VALMEAPAGAPASRLKVNVWAGRSESAATAVKVRRLLSAMDLFPIEARTGGTFTSVTTIVKVSETLKGGTPLSVTRMVIRLVLGPWASVGCQTKSPVAESNPTPAGAPGSRV